MSKTAFVVAALFAASTAFADTPTPKANPASQAPAKTQPQGAQPQAAGGQSGGANGVVVAGGAAQSRVNPALVALGVATVAVVVAASLSSDSTSNH
jgi:hypothetical protein